MNNLFLLIIMLMIGHSACSPNSADLQERDRYCRGDNCYLYFEKTDKKPDPCSGAWATSTSCGTSPAGSGSDKPLFGGDSGGASSSSDDVPTGSVGCIGKCDDNNWPASSVVGNGGGTDLDRDPPGKGNILTTIGNGIEKGIAGIAGELNGINRKKRRKAREAQQLLRDAASVMQQAQDYGTAIEAELKTIDELSKVVMKSQSEIEHAASDAALQGFADRYNGRTRAILDKAPNVDEQALGQVRRQGIYYEAGKIADGRKYLKYASERIAVYHGQKDYIVRKTLVTAAEGALDASEESYKEGNPQEGNALYQVSMACADIALSVTPIVGLGKDVYEVATGRSLLDGHQLTTFEQSMAVVGVATLGLGKLGVFGKIGKLGKILGRAATGGDDVAKVAKSVERAESVIAAAERAGVKDKKVIDEIADFLREGMPCKVVHVLPARSIFALIEDVAYAADCLPGATEKVVGDAISKTANVSHVRWGMWGDLSKVSREGREYADIGGRLYTQHAIDRMVPAGFGTAAGGSAGRGVPTTVVEYVLQEGQKVASSIATSGTLRETWKMGGVQVITEDSKKIIITVMRVGE